MAKSSLQEEELGPDEGYNWEPAGAAEVASYIADLATQLESMARSVNLELLAYLMAMARTEADIAARVLDRSPPPERRKVRSF